MDISIFGSGYVGLVTGVCLAEMGHCVFSVDIDQEKIEQLNMGVIPIYEPGLEELIKRNRKANRLTFTTSYEKALVHSSICFIGVPTPSSDNGSCDLTYVKSCARSIAEKMNDYTIIVTKSTVPMGTGNIIEQIVAEELIKRNVSIDFDVVSNPEFLKEGNAISDYMKPDRIVIGANSQRAFEVMRELYAPFNVQTDRIIEMDRISAEMTKYAANAMLATRISFMNEMAEICNLYGADINEVRKGIGSDKRIGYSFLYAGIGYGGSCFPKDIRALMLAAQDKGYTTELLQAVESINMRQKKVLSESMIKYFSQKGGIRGKTIAIWGLSFKPDTDDMREAPSLILIKLLLKQGAKLRLYDPVSMQNAKRLLKNQENLEWCNSEADTAKGADGIALLTEWKQFRLIDFKKISKDMSGLVLFDGRNQYKAKEIKKNGFDYIGIGVPKHVRND